MSLLAGTSIDGEAGFRNRGDGAALVLVAGEEERAVALDRSAAVHAALLFVKRLHGVGEEVPRVAQIAVANEARTRTRATGWCRTW